MRDVREVGLLRSDALSRVDRFLKTEVGRKGPDSTAVQNPDVQDFKQCPTTRGNRVGVGAIGDIAEAKSEYLETGTMLQANRDDSAPQQVERFQRIDAVELQAGHGSGMGWLTTVESVVKTGSQTLLNDFFTIQRYGVPEVEREESKVV